MKKALLLCSMLTFGLTFGNEPTIVQLDEKIVVDTSVNMEVEYDESKSNNTLSIPADCYAVAYAVLDAGLSSGMLINEAYDAAYAVYETCEAIQMM